MAASATPMPTISACSCARRWCWRRSTVRQPCTARDFGRWRPSGTMTESLPLLAQRRIEAAFAKGVYEEMKAELGEAAAKRILANAVIGLARQAAAEMAKE